MRRALALRTDYATRVAVGIALVLCGVVYASVAAPGGTHHLRLAVTGTMFGPQASGSGTCILPVGPQAPISAVAFSPDGRTLAVGGYKEVLLLDSTNGTAKRLCESPLTDTVRALAFQKGGQWLAVGDGQPGRSGAVRIFEITSGKLALEFREPQDVVYSIAFSPDGKLVAAGGMEPVVRVWDIEQKKLVATLTEPRDRVLGIAFSHNGAHLAAGGADNMGAIWSTATWKQVVRMPQPARVNGIAFDPQDESLVTAVEGDVGHGLRIQKIDYPELETEPNASGTATAVVTGTAQPTPKKFREKNAPARIFDTGVGLPLGVVWSATGKIRKIYVPCTDKTVRVFNTFGGAMAGFTGHDDWVYCVAVSPDGAKLASGCADGTVKLWKTENNKLLATFVPVRPGSGQWALVTPRGAFCTSGSESVEFRKGDGTALSADAVNQLRNMEQVRQSLSGEPPPVPKKPKPLAPPVAKKSPAPKPVVSGSAAVKPAPIAKPQVSSTVPVKPTPVAKPQVSSTVPVKATSAAQQSPSPTPPKP